MPTTLSTKAAEGSTYVITASFTDEDGAAEVPTAISWTLTNNSGTVINSRTKVAIAVPAASIDIVLGGLDLVLASAADNGQRVLLIEATYNSALGNGLTLKDEVKFAVEDFVLVTTAWLTP